MLFGTRSAGRNPAVSKGDDSENAPCFADDFIVNRSKESDDPKLGWYLQKLLALDDVSNLAPPNTPEQNARVVFLNSFAFKPKVL